MLTDRAGRPITGPRSFIQVLLATTGCSEAFYEDLIIEESVSRVTATNWAARMATNRTCISMRGRSRRDDPHEAEYRPWGPGGGGRQNSSTCGRRSSSSVHAERSCSTRCQ